MSQSKPNKQVTLLGFFNKAGQPPKADNRAQQSAPARSGPPPAKTPSEHTNAPSTPAVSSDPAASLSDAPVSDASTSVTEPMQVDDSDEEPVAYKPRLKRKTSHAPIIDEDDESDDAPTTRIHKKARSSSPCSVSSELPDSPPATRDISRFSHNRSRSSISSAASTDEATSEASAPSRSSVKGSIAKSHSGLTMAERKKQEKKKEEQKGEQPYSFLANPQDRDGNCTSDPGYDPRTVHVPKEAWKTFTPFEKQFWEIKQDHFDTVLFFQKGKFYELYEEDARIGHREFDLKLTQRVKMSMVGVPESSFDFWAAKFLARGYKVGRVDQSETALGAEMRVAASKTKAGNSDDKKKIVQRKLNKVLTVGTLTDASLLSDDFANHCLAVFESSDSAGASRLGMAVLDASTSEVKLGFWSDDSCRSRLETVTRQLRVKELIHVKENLTPPTLRVLKSSLPGSCLWTILRSHECLSPEETVDYLKEGADLRHNFIEDFSNTETLAALGALIRYLRQLNIDKDIMTMGNLKAYDDFDATDGLHLDGHTLAHLEILANNEGTDEGTLLRLLTRCSTPSGKRLLRAWICRPLSHIGDLNERLDAVEGIMDNPHFDETFSKVVKGLPDLERIIARVHAKSCAVKDFLKLLNAYGRLQSGFDELASSVQSIESGLLRRLLEVPAGLEVMIAAIKSMFEEPEGKAFDLVPKPGKDDACDSVREEIEQLEDELDKDLAKLERKTSLKLSYWHSAQGTKEIYLVQVSAADAKKVPANWSKAASTKTVARFNVPQLSANIRKLKEARETRKAAIGEFKYRLYQAFDVDRQHWLRYVDVIAHIDCLIGLARASASLGSPVCRPKFRAGSIGMVDFRELRHPSLAVKRDFIPNDITLGASNRVVLLTGPNMGGKSTIMRMTAIGIIMAQLGTSIVHCGLARTDTNVEGMLVPAAEANITPLHSIFTRMGAYDNMFSSASTFKVELDECCKIIRGADSKSLVMLDELGRGTSTFDGMAVAAAVLHYLASRTNALSFFATHYSSLTREFASYPCIRSMHMSSVLDEERRELVFLYKLVEGAAASSFGTHVASLAGVPASVVQRADGVSKDFAKKMEERHSTKRSQILPLMSQADFALLHRLASSENLAGNQSGLLALGTIRGIVQASA